SRARLRASGRHRSERLRRAPAFRRRRADARSAGASARSGTGLTNDHEPQKNNDSVDQVVGADQPAARRARDGRRAQHGVVGQRRRPASALALGGQASALTSGISDERGPDWAEITELTDRAVIRRRSKRNEPEVWGTTS